MHRKSHFIQSPSEFSLIFLNESAKTMSRSMLIIRHSKIYEDLSHDKLALIHACIHSRTNSLTLRKLFPPL